MTDTHVFVRNNFHTLYMPGRLKNLPEHFLCDARIQSANVQGAFVRLWCCATHGAASTHGRRDVAGGGRGDRKGDWICVLRDNNGRKRRRRHVSIRLTIALAVVLVARRTGRGGRWWRLKRGFSHDFSICELRGQQ